MFRQREFGFNKQVINEVLKAPLYAAKLRLHKRNYIRIHKLLCKLCSEIT